MNEKDQLIDKNVSVDSELSVVKVAPGAYSIELEDDQILHLEPQDDDGALIVHARVMKDERGLNIFVTSDSIDGETIIELRVLEGERSLQVSNYRLSDID